MSADCSDIPSNYNGIYEVNLATGEDDPDYNNVYCDMEQDGGGWTVSINNISLLTFSQLISVLHQSTT